MRDKIVNYKILEYTSGETLLAEVFPDVLFIDKDLVKIDGILAKKKVEFGIHKNIYKENRKMEQQMEEYIASWRHRLEEQEKYIEDVRKIKHDMQAHLVVLQYYLEEENYEAAKIYLKEIRSRQVDAFTMEEYDLGSPLVNVIVKDCLSESTEKICFTWQGEIPKGIEVSEYDMCTIFSNLMSNAVEACNKVSSREKGINLKLLCQENAFYIEMRNPVEWEINEALLGRGTTKEDKVSHGYGVRNIIDTVSLYGGESKFFVEENVFIAQIMIPNVVNSQYK